MKVENDVCSIVSDTTPCFFFWSSGYNSMLILYFHTTYYINRHMLIFSSCEFESHIYIINIINQWSRFILIMLSNLTRSNIGNLIKWRPKMTNPSTPQNSNKWPWARVRQLTSPICLVCYIRPNPQPIFHTLHYTAVIYIIESERYIFRHGSIQKACCDCGISAFGTSH